MPREMESTEPGDSTPTTLEKRLTECEKRLRKLEAAVDQLERRPVYQEHIHNPGSMYVGPGTPSMDEPHHAIQLPFPD